MLERRDGVNERIERVGQPGKIPRGDIGLAPIRVAPPRKVGCVGCPGRVIALEPAIRTIVDGQAQYRHVVGIHHAMDKTNPHPMRDRQRRAPADFLEPLRVRLRRGRAQVTKVLRDDVVRQALQRFVLTATGENLEVAEPHERRRYPAHHRACSGCGSPL